MVVAVRVEFLEFTSEPRCKSESLNWMLVGSGSGSANGIICKN